MTRDNRHPRTSMVLSSLAALVLAIVPLPFPLDALRPDFLVLVVFYWSIQSPRAGGLSLAFFAGLALGSIMGTIGFFRIAIWSNFWFMHKGGTRTLPRPGAAPNCLPAAAVAMTAMPRMARATRRSARRI